MKIDPAKTAFDNGPVVLLKLPPTGDVTSAKLLIAASGDAPVLADVGADEDPQRQLAAAATAVDWTAAINGYLARRAQDGAGPARDDNNWRVVPVRLNSTKAATVTIKDIAIQVR